jgi:GNAT superfamily N-acetyltransferase
LYDARFCGFGARGELDDSHSTSSRECADSRFQIRQAAIQPSCTGGAKGTAAVNDKPNHSDAARRGPALFAALASMPAFCENLAMPSDTDLQIRPVQESDIPVVLEFIRKLAEYGDISSEATVTESDVRAALFDERPVAQAILAYVGSEPAGFAVYSFTFSSFMGKPGIFVEDLFVEHQFRSRGIGKALLLTLARLGRERGCGRLEWSVLNWNEQAMEFYQDLGAVPMDEWTTFRLTGEALNRLASGER